MATEIVVPRLGWTMEEGIFGEWLKTDGDKIAMGDLLFTMETDKATQEVESMEAGILRIAPDGPKTGDVVPVGAVLGYLVAAGEAAPFAAPVVAAQPVAISAPPTTATVSAVVNSPRANNMAISPRARRVASELKVAWEALTGSGRTGRIIERDVRAAATQQMAQAEVKVTPVARRLAEEAGVDLATVTPAKPGARIGREDVEAAIAARTPTAPAEVAPLAPRLSPSEPTSRIRRLIAQRMSESAHTTAAVTLTTEADATELVALREQLKATFGPRALPVPVITIC